MSFDIAKAADYTEQIVKSASSVGAGMSQLLGYCESNLPNSVWANIRQLDFEGDTAKLRTWLEKVLSSEPPSAEINVFWFGLFNPVRNGGANSDLYISGSTKFDPEDETGDWAIWDDNSYLPESRYANSHLLKEIYRLVSKTEVAAEGEYILCLGFAGLAVKQIVKLLSKELLLGDRERRDIAVGFDSGDFILLEGVENESRLPKAKWG
jgi:hypothetical protein